MIIYSICVTERAKSEEIMCYKCKNKTKGEIILKHFGKGSLYDNYSLSLYQWQNFHGPEFVKMASEPCVALSVPSSIMVRI